MGTHSDIEKQPLKLETDPPRLCDGEALGFESEREKNGRLEAERERAREGDKVIEIVRNFQRTGQQN